MRIDKEGIAMKKLLGKLLAFILAVVVAICGFIVLCGINPDVKNGAKAASSGINSIIQERAALESSQGAQSASGQQNGDNAQDTAGNTQDSSASQVIAELTDAAATVTSFTVSQDQEKEFAQYESEWSSSGIEKDIVDQAEEPLVNQDLYEDSTDETAYYSITDNLSDYSMPTANVIEIETPEQVQSVISDISMGNTAKDMSFAKEYYPYYNMLTDKCKQLYKQIYGNSMEQRDVFLPVVKATPDQWKNALMSVVLDHPELFWLNTAMYTEYDYKGYVVKVQIYFYEDLGNIDEAKAQFDIMTAAILAGTDELKTAYDKEVYVHNLLADKLTYSQNSLDQSAYSAIVGNETVCAGYSKAFQYLMQQLEIPTYLTVGWGGGLASGDMHAWDIIKLGDSYYNVDVTWDDQEPINYNYFNQSDKDFHRHTRMFNSQYLPACAGEKYSKAPKTE